MKLHVYKDVCERLHGRDDIAPLSETYGIPYDTLVSLYSTNYQRYIKATQREHSKAAPKYAQSWQAGSSIVDIAEEVNFSPCLLARMIVQELVGLDRKKLTAAMKHPEVLVDKRLRDDVIEAIELDDNYSPSIDLIKRNVGLEYEYILQEELNTMGVPYVTEDQLRSEGYPKTPDVKLQSPMEVNGRVVNWIDSKAAFGDEYYHNTVNHHLKSYVNRFGPGMVIYWFGFVETLNTDPHVLIVEDIPRNIEALLPN